MGNETARMSLTESKQCLQYICRLQGQPGNPSKAPTPCLCDPPPPPQGTSSWTRGTPTGELSAATPPSCCAASAASRRAPTAPTPCSS